MQSLDTYRTPNTNKSMGIEIECVIRGLSHEAVMKPTEYSHEGFFYVGEDGSIRTDWRTLESAFEFVSQPLSAKWLKKEIDKLYKKYPWRWNDSCGIHIHVSRKWLSEAKARVIYKFMQTLDDTDRLVLFGRSSNDYCRVHREFGCDRYNAVNNRPKDTIEFRVFSSGNAEWCKYCVDMVEYLITQAHHLNLPAIYAFRDQYKF